MSDIVKEASFSHNDEVVREFAYLKSIVSEIAQEIEYRKSRYKFTTKVDNKGRSIYYLNLEKADRKIKIVDFFYSKWAKRLRMNPLGKLRLNFIREIQKDILFIIDKFNQHIGR